MKTILIVMVLALASVGASAQKYFTKTAQISFYSHTPLEDIRASSNQVTSIIDFGTGDIVFKLQIKTFQFPKALMQEHFNEKYMESDKLPESTFKGTITNYKEIDLTKDGEYTVKVKGDLTIHGVAKPHSGTALLTVKDGKVSATAKFNVKVADHNIKIPGTVKDNIAETVEVSVDANYTPLNQ